MDEPQVRRSYEQNEKARHKPGTATRVLAKVVKDAWVVHTYRQGYRHPTRHPTPDNVPTACYNVCTTLVPS